ncbi:pheromone processing endoprotease [Podochytrium sp. JEL0797]|nr:pheromone processing endoprotease [Podochytrium sp. JEL0797]
MRLFLVLSCVAPFFGHATSAPHPLVSPNDHDHFSYFAVKLAPSFDPSSLHTAASALGARMNVHFIGQVGELKRHFLFALPKSDVSRRSSLESDFLGDKGVEWAEIQTPRMRLVKRDAPFSTDDITDPMFKDQWHLLNTSPGQLGNDHNLTGAWEQGIFGKGAVVCFVDDGLDMNSNDLKDNYFAEGSYDFNAHTPVPNPKVSDDRHGTRCAGEVAAVRNNVCGVGVAFEAKVSAVRILGGALTEADEAASINYKFNENHIFSCSWGPTDDGRTMEAPPRIVSDAVFNGITNGRNGLGSIFVFASGNGGASGDNCNFDGYTNSIYTITVGAVDRNNQHPAYSEACSANLIVMYSSATVRHDDAIATTDWSISHTGSDLCTKSHGGTSAAAPLASGIYALVHSIRPDLSWRDFQHITVRSAVPISTDDKSWFKTAAGRLYSHEFGYGKLDAYRILKVAKEWRTVAPQTSYESPLLLPEGDGVIPQGAGQDVRVAFEVTEGALKENKFGALEHVTVKVNIQHAKRGDVNVDLVSPAGIVSNLAVSRRGDGDTTGFKNWTFMSVAHWDEPPTGTWKIIVRDFENPELTGKLESASIQLWGSESSSIKKKPEFVAPVPEEDAKSTPSVVATSDPEKAVPSATPGAEFVKPEPSEGGGFSGFLWSLIVLSTLATCIYCLFSKRRQLYDHFESWQQHRKYQRRPSGAMEGDELYEFQRLGDDLDGVDELDEFGEGPTEEELEELRRGGYLMDDLLFDSTQQEGV